MKKVLPVHEPLIKSFPWDAHLLSIIGNCEEEYNWIMHNYIDFFAINTQNGIYLNFCKKSYWNSCPFLVQDSVNRKIIESCNINIIEFIEKCIREDFYLSFFVSQASIPLYIAAGVHEPLIYGFDNTKKNIYIADFFDGHYTFGLCTYEQLTDGYQKLRDENNVWKSTIQLMNKNQGRQDRYKPLSTMSSPTRNTLCRSLNNYLYSKSLFYEDYADEYMDYEELSFGIDSLAALKKYLLKNPELDIRPFHAIVEHSYMMLKRSIYFNGNLFKDEFEKIYTKCKTLEMMIIKSHAIGKIETQKYTQQLDEIMNLQKDTIADWLKIIEGR